MKFRRPGTVEEIGKRRPKSAGDSVERVSEEDLLCCRENAIGETEVKAGGPKGGGEQSAENKDLAGFVFSGTGPKRSGAKRKKGEFRRL